MDVSLCPTAKPVWMANYHSLPCLLAGSQVVVVLGVACCYAADGQNLMSVLRRGLRGAEWSPWIADRTTVSAKGPNG